MYVMKEAIKYDKWNTDYLVWTDGGILHVYDQARPSVNFFEKFFLSFQPQWFHTNVRLSQVFHFPTFKEG